ncbi:serine hydrolase [Wenzhouxiangella sp. XN79A]|uniref:serine hydrolase domain-containing protein n=1 Tax=Wenzhouxiangella sp. XN79A TaxID=2724193 RepID=UPI00144AD104|nr:serine hydrolase [Wenzhouxiangella sp. XN79A]NKI35700.1 serine hydrolase [Wenzhouxiangella sp. XN79A]
MRRLLFVSALLVAIGLVAFLVSPLHRIYLPTASGFTAKQACSLHFVSGFSIERARAMYIDPLLAPALPVLRVVLDDDRREVRASLAGLYRQTAVHRPGLGCSLVHDESAFDRALALPDPDPFEALPLDTAHRAARFDEAALAAAIESAFAEPERGGRNTLSVAVLHEGRLVAERYAEGVGPATPLHGWSMTKSAMALLAGALARDGVIDLARPGIASATDDPPITLDHLLRMTSGLDMAERADGFDPNSDMLFTQSDMAAWAARRNRVHPPGTHWQYMSGNTVLAARVLQDALGDSLPEQVRGLREMLFDPVGVQTAVLEVDQAGTFQGSSYLYAGTHDWARLAQLVLQDGVWEGRRVLAEGWVERIDTATAGSRENAYGLGFWRGHPDPDAPDGIVYMDGFQSQRAIIVPSHGLVIVRLGATNFTSSGTARLVMDVIGAMSPRP